MDYHGESGLVSRRGFLNVTAAGLAGVLTARPSILTAAEGPLAPAEIKKQLTVHSRLPRNAEPTLDKLVESWMTPSERFYVRSHAPNPRIDPTQFRLQVEGMVEMPLSLSLDQLMAKFKKSRTIATMTCAGNRRYEHSRVKKVSGVQWEEGPIGNAEWGGLRLSDLLKKAGLKEGARHVWFEGLDEISKGDGTIPFGASIPIEKALSDTESMPGTIVCYEMNKQPLSLDHGFPLRTVVPGYIGARSVKWLGKIVVSDRPSPNHYVADAYKLITEGNKLELAEAGPIYRFPLNSVTCTPLKGSKLQAGTAVVRGYALPPGIPGRTIERVEVSSDGGKSWSNAKLLSSSREYCWRLWETRVSLSPQVKSLIVRATDSERQTQPHAVRWNMKGYLFNAWHRVPVAVE